MPSRGGGTSILCSWPCQSLHGSPTDQRPPAASQNPGVQSGHRIPQVAVASASVAGGCGHCLVQAGARTYPPGGRLGHPTTWGGPGDRRTEFWGYVAPGKEPTGATCSHRMQCRSCVTEAWGGGEPGGEEPQRGHPRAWSLRGGPWGVELQLAEPPWGHSDQAHCPLQGGFLALGKVRVPALCGPGVLGEKALAGLC